MDGWHSLAGKLGSETDLDMCVKKMSLGHNFVVEDVSIAYDAPMKTPDIVLDTNVIVAALRSRRGASYRLLSLQSARLPGR